MSHLFEGFPDDVTDDERDEILREDLVDGCGEQVDGEGGRHAEVGGELQAQHVNTSCECRAVKS